MYWNIKTIIICLLLMILVLVTTIGSRNFGIHYTREEVEDFNESIALKTSSEIKEEEFRSIDKKFLSSLETNKIDKIFKRSAFKDSETIEKAELILNNELYINDNWEPVKIENPSWIENPYNDNSWVLYYQSLDFLPTLLNSFEATDDIKYLEKASFYVFSWIENNREIYISKSKVAWNDHGTSNRLLNLIHFWQLYRDSSLYNEDMAKELVYSLMQHGKFLASDSNYTESNHGIMQDRALMALALLFHQIPSADEWFEIARERLVNSLERDVAADGVHKEHSPSYHTMVKSLFRGIKEFMVHYGVYNNEFDDALDSMDYYEQYLVTPSRSFPLVGDSEGKISGYQELPILGDKIFKDGGVAFFRDSWLDSKHPLYFMFTSAYHSPIHKHGDDLSFVLSLGETDYFVDAGKYKYDTQDIYRQHAISVFGHNTIAVNDKTYEFSSEKFGNPKIVDSKVEPDYSYVTGNHTLYNGVEIERTIIYLRDSNFVIHDKISSERENKYSQIFNIGEDVSIDKLNDHEFLLESESDSSSIKLTQLKSDDIGEVLSYTGSDDPVRGWQSLSLNKKHPVTSLIFNKEGKDQSYITLLNVNNNKPISNVVYSNSQESYKIQFQDGTTINITKQ